MSLLESAQGDEEEPDVKVTFNIRPQRTRWCQVASPRLCATFV